MDALNLDYQLSSQRPRPLQLLLVLMAAIAVFAVTAAYNLVQQQISERSDQLQQAQLANGATPKPAKREKHLSEAQQQAQAAVMERLNLPWATLFKALESAYDPKVALLAIEPNLKRGLVRVTAESGSLQQALAYLERLQRQGLFSSVTMSEHEIELEAPGQPVRFVLTLAQSDTRSDKP